MRYKHNIKTIKLEDNTHNLSTYIKGYYGDQQVDKNGETIPDTYEFETEYTSPSAEKYGILHAKPYKNEKIKHENAMQRYLKSKVIDEPEMLLTVEHQQLINNLTKQLEEIDLGDTLYLIHEPMDIQFNIRINEVIDFPLHPQIKPIYTLSTNSISLIDNNTLPHVSKNNNDKEISIIKSKQTEAEKRIEKTIEAVADVENAMIDVDREMDRIENEVIPAVEQAVDSAKIPTSTEPPYPIPTSRLYWDSSKNPPRLMRWNGEEWVFLAPTEDEIDDLMQQMRDEAIQEGKTYSDAEIQATRQAIINQLDKEIGDVNSSITDLNDIKDDLVNRVDTAESNIESNETAINQLSNEIELRVTKEEFENLEIGGRNLILNSEEEIVIDNTYRSWNLAEERHFSDRGIDYVLSFEGRADNAGEIVRPYTGGGRTVTLANIELTTEWKRYSVVVKLPNGNFNQIRFHTGGIGGATNFRGEFRNLKLEKGNKATDWSPAPEDAQEQIDEATERITKAETNITLNSEALELKAEKSELTNYVDKQTYNNKIGQLDVSINDITGRVESTEVDFNDFKTGDYNLFKQQYGEFKLEMDNFTTKVGELSSIDGTLVDSFSEVKQEVGLIESTVRDVRVDVNGLEDSMTAVQTTISQLPSEINLAVSEGIDGLEIGGRNLILNSEEEVVIDNTYKSWNLAEGRHFSDRGIDYVLSFEGRADNAGEIVRPYTGGGTIVTLANIELTTEWKRYSVVVKLPNGNFNKIRFHTGGIGGATNFRGEFRNLKLEKGNKATDWSPAPEDQVNKTNVLSSINLSTEGVKIEGAKIDIKGVAEFMSNNVNLLPMHPSNWENGYISISGGKDIDRDYSIRTADFIAIEPNTEYTLNNISGASIFIREFEEDGFVNNHPTKLSEGNDRTFTTGENSRYIRFYWSNSSVDKIFPDEIGVTYKATFVKGSTPLSWEDAKTTIINGGRIVTNNITANQLNVNNIFGNSAVIDKIQADIVRTSELDATQITTGTLDAAKANLINVSASSITTGTLDGLKARIKNIDASEINSGTLNAINITGSVISGGRLQALNNNTNFNLNTGQLTIGNGADIEFEHYGNRLYYNIKDTEGSRLTRSAGMGVGRSINDRFPYAFLGTSTGTRPHPRDDEYFVGFIANTNARITVDGIGNSSVGDVFQVRDNAVSYNKGFEFDLRGSNNFRMRPINSGSYSYWLGASDNQFNGVYTANLRTSNGYITFRNSSTSYLNQGFRMDTTYDGDDQLYFRGIHSDDYHSLGRPGGWRFRNLYLRYQPDVSSDERLKTGIKEIDNAYEIINALEPIQYRYKLSNKDLELKNSGNMPRGLNVNQYGFSAQQVKKVLDDLGIESQSLVNLGEDNYYGMQTTQVIPLLVKAFQEEKQRNDDLKSRIEQIEQQMEQLLA